MTAAKPAAVPMVIMMPVRTARAADPNNRGKPVEVSSPVPPPPPGVGVGVDDTMRSRNSSGAAKAGAAPMRANGAYFLRLRSQVEHASMWRATRLRNSTLNSPSQFPRIEANSAQSRRPRRATQNAPKLRSVRSRIRCTRP